MNKYERNAVQVTLDHFIDNMIDVRSYFEDESKPITFNTIVNFGDYVLILIKEHLESDIDLMIETIESDMKDDEEEKKHWTTILNDQKGALKIIDKAIEYRKNLGPDGLPLKHLESGIYLNGKRLTDEG
jgi:hypothetical protein|tara:strand:- start:769 stop:1155 length:387 start_codon:yes stop_codon:yes gene_type:complete